MEPHIDNLKYLGNLVGVASSEIDLEYISEHSGGIKVLLELALRIMREHNMAQRPLATHPQSHTATEPHSHQSYKAKGFHKGGAAAPFVNGPGKCASITVWLCGYVALWFCGSVAL